VLLGVHKTNRVAWKGNVDIAEELGRAIAVANAEAEPHACVSRFLAREFGKRNARPLLRDARGAVSRLYKAHRAMKLAIQRWEGSRSNTDQVMRAAVAYMEQMHEVSLLCSAPPIRSPIQMALMERRKERTDFYRDRQLKAADANPSSKVNDSDSSGARRTNGAEFPEVRHRAASPGTRACG